jgi:hypothetical protein
MTWWMRALVVLLPFEPVTGDDPGALVEAVPLGRGEGAEEEAYVVVHRHARLPGRRDGGMRRGVEVRDARGSHEERHAVEPAREVADLEALGLGGVAGGRAVVPHERRGAAGPQGARGREARAAEAQDGDRGAGHALDRDHGSLTA